MLSYTVTINLEAMTQADAEEFSDELQQHLERMNSKTETYFGNVTKLKQEPMAGY